MYTSASYLAYFGNGCFWARQHGLIAFERDVLNRSDEALTATAAYGGSSAKSLCYENANDTRVYSRLGAAEVVSLTLSVDEVALAARAYFESFVRCECHNWFLMRRCRPLPLILARDIN